jgi:hypothetical protein
MMKSFVSQMLLFWIVSFIFSTFISI